MIDKIPDTYHSCGLPHQNRVMQVCQGIAGENAQPIRNFLKSKGKLPAKSLNLEYFRIDFNGS